MNAFITSNVQHAHLIVGHVGFIKWEMQLTYKLVTSKTSKTCFQVA